MHFKEFLVSADPFNAEIISGVLWNLNITGISEEVNCLRVFSEDASLQDIEGILQQLVDNKLIRSFHIEENFLEQRNWNEEWENSRNIIRVTDRIVIKPTFKNYSPSENELVLVIDPKMSFGTGEHQTTKLMLKLLQKYVQSGMNILDAGTGTGILPIAAVKLGAGKATAFDNDEWCRQNCMENSTLNNTTDKIEFKICTLDEIMESGFDIITANIQKNVLIDLADGFAKKLNPKGKVLVSGLLNTDSMEMKEHYGKLGLVFIEEIEMDEWTAMVFSK